MRKSLRTGFIFGLTSGTITTLGLIVGLHSGTHSKLAVIGTILTIAIADAFSDSMGIHLSEESNNSKDKNVWNATFSTFISKLLFPLTFIIPVVIFDLGSAITISIIWGLLCISYFSYKIAKHKKRSAIKIITQHVTITAIVVVFTHYIGELVAKHILT